MSFSTSAPLHRAGASRPARLEDPLANATIGNAEPHPDPHRTSVGAAEPGPNIEGHAGLLQTKLYAPRHRGALVARPQLVDALDRAARATLVLLSAPAGYGKTTVVAQWKERSADRLPVAWITLDRGDSDPGRFWKYVTAALQTVEPSLGARSAEILDSTQVPPLEAVITTLINELAEREDRIALVLDAYHTVESSIVHRGLEFLVDHAPSHVNVFMTTRTDPALPLGRWRLEGKLAEFRATDLRFSGEDAQRLLRDVMGIPISAADAALLNERADGWVAGLQMAGHSLRGRESIRSFVEDFGGQHRQALDFLADEVLERQPEDRRRFLLETAILDRLSDDLCDAVTGREDSQSILEGLEADNLFILPLDDRRRWWRYHRMFADVLRGRLEAELPASEIGLRHRRAAQWYHDHGYDSRAVGHFLATGDSERAADLIERLAEDAWSRGRHATLLRWLDELDRDVLASRPHLGVLRALALLLGGEALGEVEPQLAAAERSLAGTPDEATITHTGLTAGTIRARSGIVRTTLAGLRGRSSEALAAGRQALERLPADDDAWRVMALLDIGLATFGLARFADAGDAFAEARSLAIRTGGTYTELAALINLARAIHAAGRLVDAEAHYREALAEADRRGLRMTPLIALAEIGLGDLLRERDRLDEARRHIDAGVLRARSGPAIHVRSVVAGGLARSALALAEDNQQDAVRALAAVDEQLRLHRRSEFGPLLARQRARVALATGDLPPATRWAAGIESDGDPPPDSLVLAARIRMMEGDVHRAAALLERVMGQHPDGSGNLPLAQQLRLLLARSALAAAEDRESDADGMLQRAIRLAEPEGYVRLFVDALPPVTEQLKRLALADRDRDLTGAYIQQLLDAAGVQPSESGAGARAGTSPDTFGTAAIDETANEQLLEPLSPREREVLELIARGATNKEIAEELVVAVSTVKTHVNNTFGKLGVNRRTQAVARARELGVLDG